MKPLLDAIKTAFYGSTALTAAFPGLLWAEESPEGTSMPFVVTLIHHEPGERVYPYGSTAWATVTVEFVAVGVGHDAMAVKADTLVSFFADNLLALSQGQVTDALQVTEPTRFYLGRDASAADDANANDVWSFHTQISYTTRGA